MSHVLQWGTMTKVWEGARMGHSNWPKGYSTTKIMPSTQAEEVTWNRGLIRVQGWDLVWVSSYWAIVLCNTWVWVFFYYYCYDFWYWLLLVEAVVIIIIMFVSFIKMFLSQTTILLLILLSIPLWRGGGDQAVVLSNTQWY